MIYSISFRILRNLRLECDARAFFSGINTFTKKKKTPVKTGKKRLNLDWDLVLANADHQKENLHVADCCSTGLAFFFCIMRSFLPFMETLDSHSRLYMV